jgi:hypothetical protein
MTINEIIKKGIEAFVFGCFLVFGMASATMIVRTVAQSELWLAFKRAMRLK